MESYITKPPIQLLFSIDDGYLKQLMTVLLSCRWNTPNRAIDAYIISKQPLQQIEVLISFGQKIDINIYPITIDDDVFESAPASDRWPESIYYRLLAHYYLPERLDRILYLDADILVLNHLGELYDLDMEGEMYAASQHTALKDIVNTINKVRLQTFDSDGYFNSGVILMDLNLKRKRVKREDIYQYINNNRINLLLPDQDILNGLYGKYTLSIPDRKFNYDARYPLIYEMYSNGAFGLEEVINETIILHFCGKEKPWLDNHRTRFSALYKHYAHQVNKILNDLSNDSID